MFSIFKKEVASYFSTPFGYIFIGIFLLLTGIAFVAYNLAGGRGDFNGMLGILSFISIAAFPVLTMKLLAEEKKTATDQLLFTSRLGIADIVMGKYLAAIFMFLITLVSTSVYVVFLAIFGAPTFGAVLGSYLGFFLLGSAFIAVSLFASSLTENQVTSAILAFGLLLVLMVVGTLEKTINIAVIKKIINWISIFNRFDEFTRGILRVGPLVYYISISVIFIFLTVQVLNKRRWGSGGELNHNIIDALKNRKFKLGFNTFIMVVTLSAIVIIANILADNIPWTYDMTREKIFSLSEQTKKAIAGISKDITITAFNQEDNIDPTVMTLLNEYKKAGAGKIRVAISDAEKNPALAKRYDVNNEGVANGSIIFESNGKIKKLDTSDIYLQNSYSGTNSFRGEQQFTGAITYLTANKLPKVYFLEGHQEMSIDNELTIIKSRLESEACKTESLNLLKTGSVPEDADVLVIPSPKRDLSSDEEAKIMDFISKGGRAIFLFDIQNSSVNLTNFSKVLNYLGIDIRHNYVVEEAKGSFYSNNKLYLIPDLMEHSVTEKLIKDKLYVILPYAKKVDILENKDDTIYIDPLIRSSKNSWIRYDVQNDTPERTAKDTDGPADLAVAVTKTNYDDKYRDTRVVVVGNAVFLNNKMAEIQGNFDFFMNSINWLQDRKDAISIRPKLLDTDVLYVKGSQYIFLMVAALVIIPLLAFLSGFAVWITRRNL